MGIKSRRKVFRTGPYSKAITLPSNLKVSERVTLVAGRIIVIDPTGEIPEDALLDFLEEEIEPRFWQWSQSLQVNREEPA